jgi:hypothetical protein
MCSRKITPSGARSEELMSDLLLTPDQEAEAQRLRQLLLEAFTAEADHLARLLASKSDAHLLGRTEFEVREAVHRLGAKALETALRERKKRGTAARA